MKNLYISAICLLISFASSAQSYSISPNDTVFKLITTSGFYDKTIDLENISNDTITLGWEIVNVTVADASWDYSYCDYQSCYTATDFSGTMYPAAPGVVAFFKVNLTAPTVGTGEFVVKVFDVNDPSNPDTLVYQFEAVLGVDEVDYPEVSIYPNPVTDGKLTVKGIRPDTKLDIKNSLGQTVVTKNISNNSSLTISNLDLNRGVYFMRLTSGGNIYSTRKLIVK